MSSEVISIQDALETRDCITPNCIKAADGTDYLCSPCRKKENLLKLPKSTESEMQVNQLLCKWEGCNNVVVSYKGTAGYCVATKINGKTHRQLHIERQKKKKAAIIEKNPQSVALPKAFSEFPLLKVSENTNSDETTEIENAYWLSDVKFQLMIAIEAVTSIEKTLKEEKENLRKILEQAQKDLA